MFYFIDTNDIVFKRVDSYILNEYDNYVVQENEEKIAIPNGLVKKVVETDKEPEKFHDGKYKYIEGSFELNSDWVAPSVVIQREIDMLETRLMELKEELANVTE